MRSGKIPGIVVLFLVAVGLLLVNACMALSAFKTATPTPQGNEETGSATLEVISNSKTDTPEPETTASPEPGTLSPEDLTALPGGDTAIPGNETSSPSNVTLIPLEMTETAFSILLHGGGTSTYTPTRLTTVTLTPIPGSGSRTATPSPTRGTPFTLTPFRTYTHPASWYWTSTPTRSPTRGSGTLTAIKDVTYIYATRTGRAATVTSAARTANARHTKTAVGATTQAALTTGTRTSVAETAAEQTLRAQIATISAHFTETVVATAAIGKITETAQYWPAQTDVAAVLQPTYLFTPAPTPTPDTKQKVVYTGTLNGVSNPAILIKYSTPSIGLWAFISGAYTPLLNDVSPDGHKLVFEMNGKLYITYPKDSALRVDLLWNQDTLPDGTNIDGTNSQAAFTPDGEWIAFRKENGPQPGLYLIRWSGGNLTRLTNDGNDQYPDWSQDVGGTTLVFTGSDGKLYTLAVGAKPPASPLTPVSLSVAGIHAHFSPSGTKMVYEQSGKIKLAAFSSNPNALTGITWTDPSGSMPAWWSTDGSRIIFVSTDGKIYFINATGTSPILIGLPDTNGAQNPNWMP